MILIDYIIKQTTYIIHNCTLKITKYTKYEIFYNRCSFNFTIDRKLIPYLSCKL